MKKKDNIKKHLLVLTPTLGIKSSLERTINSVKNISGNDIDHKIVCPNKTFNKLKNLYRENQIIVEPNNIRGIFDSLNWALKNISDNYKYFAYINDDDYWLPDMFKLLQYSLKSQKDIIYSNTLFFNEESKFKYVGGNYSNTNLFCDLALAGIPQFTQQSVLIKYTLLKEFNFFDTSLPLNADTDFFYRVIFSGKSFKYINAVTSVYSLGPGRLTSSKRERKKSQKLFLKKHFNKKRSRLKIIISILIFRIKNIPNYTLRLMKKLFVSIDYCFLKFKKYIKK